MTQEETNTAALKHFFDLQKPLRLEAVLGTMTDDVIWHVHDHNDLAIFQPGGCRYSGQRRGLSQVEDLFKVMDKEVEFLRTDLLDFLANKDKVVVFGFSRWRARRTGRETEYHWAAVYTFKGGKIAECRAFDDTAKVAEAFGLM